LELLYKNIVYAPEQIALIGQWYHEEWNIAPAVTEKKLRNCGFPIPLHIVAYIDGNPVATGGIHREVGIHTAEPRFKNFTPWLALLYTVPELRGTGIGSMLCDILDTEARKLKIPEYFLYTRTAQSLYKRKGWEEMEQLTIRKETVSVMHKIL
jgi:GNAT superfamily N-acetyltransferase